jgi:hypothetical protein
VYGSEVTVAQIKLPEIPVIGRMRLGSVFNKGNRAMVAPFCLLPRSRQLREAQSSITCEEAESSLGARNLGTDRKHFRVVGNVGLSMGVGMLLILGGCSRDSRIHVKLHDIPETKSELQTARKINPPLCPPGDPPGNDASSSPAGQHKVNLSWNASPSAGPGTDIRYCLYRSVGGPVQRSLGTLPTSPCINCQLVTIIPVTGTTYQDTRMENGAHYCYVAVALDASSGKVSDFSNQVDAIIPPRREPPFCTPKNAKKAHAPNP